MRTEFGRVRHRTRLRFGRRVGPGFVGSDGSLDRELVRIVGKSLFGVGTHGIRKKGPKTLILVSGVSGASGVLGRSAHRERSGRAGGVRAGLVRRRRGGRGRLRGPAGAVSAGVGCVGGVAASGAGLRRPSEPASRLPGPGSRPPEPRPPGRFPAWRWASAGAASPWQRAQAWRTGPPRRRASAPGGPPSGCSRAGWWSRRARCRPPCRAKTGTALNESQPELNRTAAPLCGRSET